MIARITGLLLLAGLGIACLWASSYWMRGVAIASEAHIRERDTYRAYTWLTAFVILAAAWVWLLVTTVRRRPGDEYDEPDSTESRS